MGSANDVIKIKTADELKLCFPVLKELRTELTYETFLETYENAYRTSGYELVGIKRADAFVAVMGFRILHDYVHGKHLYIDDLVSTASQRSKGLGAELLTYAESEARRLGCSGLRLCTGVENEAGKRFYEKLGWSLRAVAYKKRLI